MWKRKHSVHIFTPLGTSSGTMKCLTSTNIYYTTQQHWKKQLLKNAQKSESGHMEVRDSGHQRWSHTRIMSASCSCHGNAAVDINSHIFVHTKLITQQLLELNIMSNRSYQDWWISQSSVEWSVFQFKRYAMKKMLSRRGLENQWHKLHQNSTLNADDGLVQAGHQKT